LKWQHFRVLHYLVPGFAISGRALASILFVGVGFIHDILRSKINEIAK
jgi:hypothetical protein